ncbi:MAG: glycosyltransferase [Bacilli bacterium]|nr:glycosyltransferase [Bacilli bacterium]
MNKSKFRFTVIMAIYNVEKYLEEAINSVINQSLDFKKNIQIVLVNDGSPDNSEDICKKYIRLYPNNIKYIKKVNGGVSSARNAGLEIADGEIINFLDSDDYFSKNAFKKVDDFFKKYKNKTDVVALNLINFEASSGSWVNKDFFSTTRIIDMKSEYHFMQCQVGASFIKRDQALSYKFDERIKIHEDSQYLFKIFRDKPFCGVISDATYYHRIRNNKSSATQNINLKSNIFNMSKILLPDIINFYYLKDNKIPSFLQTFIILEFNFYVLNNINKVNFNKAEKKDICDSIKKILSILSEEDIKNHPYIDNIIKTRYLILKRNITLIFNKSFMSDPINYKASKKLIKRCLIKIRRILGKIKRRFRFPFSKTIKNVNYLMGENINNINIINNQELRINNNEKNINNIKNKTEYEILELKKMVDNFYKNVEIQNEELKRLNSELAVNIKELQSEFDYNFSRDVKYISYFYGGSDNRGCEALAKTISKKLECKRDNLSIITFRKKDDIDAKLNKYIKYIVEPKLFNSGESKIEYMGNCRFNYSDMGITEYIKNLNADNNVVALSIGGDNYCYGDYICSLLKKYNNIFHNYGIKTALIGCSIDEDVFKNKNVIDDLNLYDLIIARESLTYNNLIKAGINKNTCLIPDPAFELETINLELPKEFIINKTIGINMSPIVACNDKNNLVYKNYDRLIRYILDKTNYNIALIPHVFWDKSNDYEIMLPFYKKYLKTRRICIIEKSSSEELKGFISRCKIFIGARTHATIAAYSSFVPTLVVGYSIKSKGIATDIFGDYKNYVLSIDDIKSDDQLIKSFLFIEKNCDSINKYLKDKIPKYLKPLKNYKKIIKNLDKKGENK